MFITYDCEFLEDGKTIDLISIGLVRGDGKELYAVNANCNWDAIIKNWWLRDNVVPSLPLDGTELDCYSPLVMPKPLIAMLVKQFILEVTPVELWAYYSAYDHVALCQLWGRMIDLPPCVPMYTHDLKCEMMRPEKEGLYIPPQPSGNHNALEDARYNLVRAKYLGIIP